MTINTQHFEQWRAILGVLTEREALVISRRFGLLSHDCATLEEVGQELGVTRERIRQIEAKALRKLRVRAMSLGAKAEEYLS